MGMYTELNIGVKLNEKAIADGVVEVLEYMTGQRAVKTDPLPNHPLFQTPRWQIMMNCGSAYFMGQPDSKVIISKYYPDEDIWLNVRTNLKNYDYEIELFLDWIQPYIEYEEFIGYMRYEEFERPTLIYNTDKGIELQHLFPDGTYKYYPLSEYLKNNGEYVKWLEKCKEREE